MAKRDRWDVLKNYGIHKWVIRECLLDIKERLHKAGTQDARRDREIVDLSKRLDALSCVAEEDEHEEKHRRREREMDELRDRVESLEGMSHMHSGFSRTEEASTKQGWHQPRPTAGPVRPPQGGTGEGLLQRARDMQPEDSAGPSPVLFEEGEHEETEPGRDDVIAGILLDLGFAAYDGKSGAHIPLDWDDLEPYEQDHVKQCTEFPHTFAGPDATCHPGDVVETGTKDRHYLTYWPQVSHKLYRWIARGSDR